MCSSVGTMYRNVANSGTYGGICVFVCHMLCGTSEDYMDYMAVYCIIAYGYNVSLKPGVSVIFMGICRITLTY